MAYNGSVELISGIKQKNNGTFPLVDASAVQVDDETRLDETLQDNEGRIDELKSAIKDITKLTKSK